ncbi:hypothetical protein BO443_60071 [Burkholderia orbicola]
MYENSKSNVSWSTSNVLKTRLSLVLFRGTTRSCWEFVDSLIYRQLTRSLKSSFAFATGYITRNFRAG